MTAFTCAAIWLLFPLVVVIGIVSWLSESRHTRIQRQRSYGWSWKQIAEHHHCSQSTARRWAAG